MDKTRNNERRLHDVQQKHPIGSIRYYRGRKCEVIDYEQESSGYVYVICNVEDPYRMGFRTQYVSPNLLTEKQ